MELYLVRHGIAVPSGTVGVAEEDRPLTNEGVRKMEVAARGYRALGVVPELILTSPLARAAETARILRSEFGRKVSLEVLAELAPGGSRSRIYQEIAERERSGSLMLVGHQPSLGEMAGEIAWGRGAAFIDLKKGGGCGLEITRARPSPKGVLLWLLPPSFLRALGE